MQFIITFSNNETVTFAETDLLHAWKNDTTYLNVGDDQAFYLDEIFNGSYQDAIATSSEQQLAKERPILALAGLFADADWLTFETNPDKYYQTKAIVSLTTKD